MEQNEFHILIILIFMVLSSIHSFWGKNLPKPILGISILSSVALGFYIGYLSSPFPKSLYISLPCASSFLFIMLLHRLSRKNHNP